MLVEGTFCRGNISWNESLLSVLTAWEMRLASAVTSKRYIRSPLGIVHLAQDSDATDGHPKRGVGFACLPQLGVDGHNSHSSPLGMFVQSLGVFCYFSVAVGAIVFS